MADYVPCPTCGAERPRRVSFTWWGGLFGPALLSHVRCPHCGTQYNGRTGRSNAAGIAISAVVTLLVGSGLVFLGLLAGGQ